MGAVALSPTDWLTIGDEVDVLDVGVLLPPGVDVDDSGGGEDDVLGLAVVPYKDGVVWSLGLLSSLAPGKANFLNNIATLGLHL